MSQFADAMAGAWDSSILVFGDRITINGTEFDCVIHGFGLSDSVQAQRPGRTQSADGTVVLKRADWIAAEGRKGLQVQIEGNTYRVTNEPLTPQTSDTVILNIGPLT